MKKLILISARILLLSILTWTSNTSAGDIQQKIETFYDDSASMSIQQISEAKLLKSSGEIRRTYQKGALWLKVTTEKNAPDAILYFENPAIDQISIFSANQLSLTSWTRREILFRDLLHGYALDEIASGQSSGPFTFYLKIRSTSPKQFNVMVLSESEARNKEYKKYAILSSQITAAVILMVWVLLQNWLARSKIFITVIISTPVFVLSSLNYFGYFLNEDSSNSIAYLNLNMILFLGLITGGTLMVKESFGRLFSKQQDKNFLLFFACSLVPSIGLFFDVPRSHMVMISLAINFAMVVTLFRYLKSTFSANQNLIWTYKFQILIFITYAMMSTLPGLYFVAPQIFPFNLGIPAYRDFFYPVLAFLIMVLMLNEQKEKEMDAIFNLAVTKANADLEIEKNRKQHVFLGMLLHEIKTPLSVIKFGAAALTSEASKNKLWTTRVDSAADTINDILNQCLLADKFEFGLSGYTEERVDIQLEISKLVERVGYLNPTYPERIEWQFSNELPSTTVASADPIFLRSILENLITNALKYSATNSKILVLALKPKSDNEDMIEFQVKNQIGKVGPPQIDKVFSRYYRAEEAKGYSGTGLGLWLANQQAQEMGSSIHCSFDEIWTTFSFQIRKLNDPT